MNETLYVYGDSLLKATVPDEQFRYHFHIDELLGKYVQQGEQVVNRAKMGATIRKGEALVQHDLDRGLEARCALVGYGGNDSDFDWAAVAAEPEGEHHPKTELQEFMATLRRTAGNLKERGIQPVLMTLPPIDAQRYLDFICRKGLDRSRILGWLGDCQMIYRFQDLYSHAVARVASEDDLPLIPAREAFLWDRSCANMIAADGIHLTMPGYGRLYDTISQWIHKHI